MRDLGPGTDHVELRSTTVGEGTKVPHLSYVSDADIGEHTGIGAATVFAASGPGDGSPRYEDEEVQDT